MTTTGTNASKPVTAARLVSHGLTAAIIAGVANVLVRLTATGVFDVPTGFGPLGWGPVINTTVVGVVGATVVYGSLDRLTSRPNRVFLGVALVVLLLSFVPLLVPPTFLDEAPGTVLGTLAVMHVTTAAIVLGFLPRSTVAGATSR